MTRVEQLRDQVARDRDRLVHLQEALEQNRNDKRMEEDNLRDLERERSSKLAEAQLSARRTEQNLDRLRRTETQLANTIAAFEAERRRAEGARGTAARSASTIKTSDYGQLDWSVDGPLVYSYGKSQTASNATIRWNGVGIRAAVGTAVRAVANGTVGISDPDLPPHLHFEIRHGGPAVDPASWLRGER